MDWVIPKKDKGWLWNKLNIIFIKGSVCMIILKKGFILIKIDDTELTEDEIKEIENKLLTDDSIDEIIDKYNIEISYMWLLGRVPTWR